MKLCIKIFAWCLCLCGTWVLSSCGSSRKSTISSKDLANVEWQEVEVLDETERGAGGFGHTGKK